MVNVMLGLDEDSVEARDQSVDASVEEVVEVTLDTVAGLHEYAVVRALFSFEGIAA